MSIITSIGVWAQEGATAPAKFIVSDNGKTLTVSGKGDLTTLNITMNMGKIFTNVAAGNVFSDVNGTSVTEGSAYNSSSTYYKSSYSYTPTTVTVPTAYNSPFGNVTKTNKWIEGKLANLYTGYYSSWNTSIVLQSKVTAESSIDLTSIDATNYPNNSKYFIYTGAEFTGDKTIAVSDLQTENVTWLTLEQLKECYTTETKYYITEDNIFVSTDGGNTFDARPNSWTDEYTYNTGEVFYKRSVTYVAIEDNTTYFETNSSYITDKNETNSFVNLLNAKILEDATVTSGSVTNTFETVRFVNEDSSTPLIINDDIVQAILFPTKDWGSNIIGKEKNNSIVTLDLGQATIENLTSNAFIKNGNNQLANMANLTLPLTKMTSVYSESSKKYEDKMVLPTQVLEHYSNYTPGNGQANLVTVTIPYGYDRLADKAFYSNAQITTFNLPSSLKLIGESAFENCGALTSITLNEGLENIGKRAFVGTNLTEISFPHSLRIINDAAFADLKDIKELKFNAGLYYIGNSAFALTKEMTVKTIEIPASVKYIGPFAFNFRQYQDVFFLGADAPIMPIGNSTYSDWKNGTAFPAHTLMGNNGFQPGTQGKMPTVTDMKDDANSGYANRENYYTNGYYFCILHFPTGLTDEQRAKYTDITRVYKTHRDANGNFYYSRSDGNKDSYDEVGSEETSLSFGGLDASTKVCYGYEDTYLGSQYIWPSQEQWKRSYVVNSLGYNWNGVTEYRTELSDEDIEVLKYAGYKIGTGEGEYTKEYLQKIAHMGTRQFVLTNADTKKDENPEEEPVYPISMKGSNWWTICVPFNMTKAQVDEVFGSGTHVCRFSSVTRTDDGKGNKSITLRFQNDVYATKWTRDAKTLAYNKESGSPADNDIVIYSHEAYMIYPTKSSEDANGMYNIKDYKLETGSPLPTIIKANANETENADQTEYRFVGNYVTEVSTGTATNADAGVATAAYETVTIPQYSYIYAKKKNDAAYKFWFFTGTQMAWSPNKCVVQATARDGGAQDYSNFFGGNANNSKVSQVSLFGEDGTVTEIENVTIIAGEGENAQIVYNLNGQVVSSNGNTDRLAKGVYIKGGKKFMVK